MRLLLGMAARNALRNVQRTMLTAGTVVLGTMLLTIALTWQNGVFGGIMKQASAGSGHVRIATTEFVHREQLMLLYENIADVGPVVAAVSAAPGVRSVHPRIASGVTLTAGDEIGEVFGLAIGAPPGWYTEELDLDGQLVDGRLHEGDGDIVLGAALADRLGARVGTEVVVVGQTQDGALSPVKGDVVGVVRAGNAMIDQAVYLTLPRMQHLADMDGGATEVLVYGDDLWRADELKDAVVVAAPGLSVQAWSEREPWSGILATAGVIRKILTGIIVFITALGVWNTMMMSVLERTSEIGVLRALGMGRVGAVFLFVVEAASIAIIGGLVGVGLGSIGGYVLETRGVTLGGDVVQNAPVPLSAHMYGDLDARTVVLAFLLGLLMAVLGSAVPALRAASIQPVVAMRARR